MANGKYLLDTNIVIAIIAQDDSVTSRIASFNHIFIPNIVIGELYFGAHNSKQKEKNISVIESIASNYAVVSCGADTAKHYGAIKYELKKMGKPIPENDIWIAALARQYNMIVVTRDSHFNYIFDLEVESC